MKIYKKDSKGKIRELDIHTIENTLYQVSGLKGGKKVEHSKECKGKNLGKSNETTGGNQAIREKEALIIKKLKEGYFKTELEAKNSNVILPMLAKSFNKESNKIEYPCFVQPKFDGIRCLAIMKNNTVILISRKNRKIVTMNHIILELQSIYKEGMILDGELYAHGETFQENMKLIKKYRKGKTEKVKYCIYDKISTKPFEKRTEELSELRLSQFKYLTPVKTMELTIKEDLVVFHKMFLQEGYEGTMIRWGKAGYKVNGRSSNLLKYKDFKDIALPIIDIIESGVMPGHGIVIIKYNSHFSKTGSKISHADRKDLWENRKKYIGKIAEIRYFEETDKGGLRFPIFMGIRIDK